MYVGNIIDSFQIAGRGWAISVAVGVETFCLKVGDFIEVRTGSERRNLKVLGVEIGHSDPITDKFLYAFLLPIEVKPEEIPRGAEVWTAAS